MKSKYIEFMESSGGAWRRLAGRGGEHVRAAEAV
jgi:hypothetical protein